MALLREFAQLLAVPSGSLVYQLIALFGTQVLLVIAFGHWRRRRDNREAFRTYLTMAAMAAARGLLVVVGLLSQAGIAPGLAIIPPLERFVDLVALFLVTWTFIPVLREYRRLGTALLLIGLTVGGGIYVISAFLWLRRMLEGSFFNHYWQSSLWELLNIAILLPTLVLAALSRRHDWGMLTCLFALLLAGHACEYAVPIADANAAGWVRLANLGALPVLASLVYGQAVRASAPAERDISLELVSALAAICRVDSGTHGTVGLGAAAAALARALEADFVALGLANPDGTDRLTIVTHHPPGNPERAVRAVVLSVADHPMLSEAIRVATAREPIRLAAVDTPAGSHSQSGQRIGRDPAPSPPDVEASVRLCHALGIGGSGALLVRPLADGDAFLGVVLAGNPTSHRSWRHRDERILDAVQPALVAVLAAARRRPGDRVAEMPRLAEPDHSLAEQLSSLQEQLVQQDQRIEALIAERDEARRMSEQVGARLRAVEQQAAEAAVRSQTASHEQMLISLVQGLRSSLTSIAGYTEILLDEAAGILGEMQHQFLLRIRTNIDRVNALIDQLLEAAAIRPQSLPPRQIDIESVVTEAIESLSAALNGRRLTVRKDFAPSLPPVEADPEWVSQAIDSVLSNACLASQEGTGILIRARQIRPDGGANSSDEFVLVSVTDTGGGISPDDQQRLFRRGYQADNRPVSGAGDTGVGLSLAKALVEAHGGRVWLQSDLGSGTTFSILIPLKPKQLPRTAGGDAPPPELE